MLLQMIQTLYAFNAWANERILDTSELLTEDQFLAPAPINFPSVQATLLHIMGVQHNWLTRFRSSAKPATLEASDFPDVASVRKHWQGVEQETQLFVASLDDAHLEKVGHYVNDQNETNAYPLWQMMFHQVNHATQHRSEVALVLTEYGYSPGWLDFLIYIDQSRS